MTAILTALALSGCGGGGGSTPVSCQAQADLPVSSFSYDVGTPILAGSTVDILPSLAVIPGRSLANVPLHFELISGSLPTGLSLEQSTGRISGKAQGPTITFPFTVRLSADCFTGTLTSSGLFTVN
jgi:hypothetical protein